MKNSNDRRRLLGLSFFLFFLFSLLILRFYQIQIVEGERWTKIALSQHQLIVKEPFRRGTFFSNTSIKKGHPEDEQPFVVDVQKFHCYIDPDSVPKEFKEDMAKRLSGALCFAGKDHEWLKKEFERKSRSRRVATFLERSQKEAIESWWTSFCKERKIARNALYFLPDYQRSYPFGPLLGPVLHTVQQEKDPETGQAIPTGGLELLFAKYLNGKPGRRLITHSPRHSLDTGVLLEKPENGADVYLTINHYLQAVTEAELEKGVRAARAIGGWAVLMDPYTGEILALAQVPGFHPARYASYFNDPKLQGQTRVKAVSDSFEPGSIMKPITAAICLKANEELKRQGKPPLFSPDEKIRSDNGLLPGRKVPLKDGRVVHRYLNLDLALQKSSNIYMARLVQRVIDAMGEKWYRQALLDFGFGQKTGVELPAEEPGLVPTPGKLHPNGTLEWSTPTPFSLAIGHNILVNTIQLARAYAMFANGGYAIQPHLIRKIVADGSQVLCDNTRLGIPHAKQVLSSSIVQKIGRSLRFITKPGGTSVLGDIMGYTEAGKSGTAEKVINGTYARDHQISSFVGFAPAKNPRFVLIVSIDDPERRIIPGIGKNQLGGVCAAPVFREIATAALEYLGVTPDDPYGYPPGDPRRDTAKADWMNEVKGLQDLYKSWNQ